MKAKTHPMDKSHIKLSYITHFYINQENLDAVTELFKRYETYNAYLLDQIQFILVDDGSPIEYTLPNFNLNLTWLKIKTDIPWNQAGARNLGVTYAKSDKILLTDLDHEFPEETLMYLLKRKECGRNFYKIYRTDLNTGKLKKGHSNIFLMSRARFMRFFGYDEEFAGNYGSEDYRFVKVHKYHGSRQLYLPKKYRCFHRMDINRNKSYHSLKRDLTNNTPIDKRKLCEIKTHGGDNGFSRIFLNFEWEILNEYNRKISYRKPEKKWWQPLWYFRWIKGYN